MIYAEYPRKQGKADALKAIEKALTRYPVARLIERTRAYAAAVARYSDHDRQFVPHPATWFNRDGFEDDPRTWERSNANPNQSRTPTAEDHHRGFFHGTEFEAGEQKA